MSGLNKVMIIGRLGRDPEMRYTPDGIAIANFSVATSEDWKDKNTGEKKEKTEWHRVVAFRRLAEVCGEYLVKGKQVYVEGKLNTRSWEKDGITRYITEITADRVQFLDSGRSSQDSSALQSGQESSNTPNTATSNSGYDYINTPADDDIPFQSQPL